jgi:predicted transcriptional regulator YdeE
MSMQYIEKSEELIGYRVKIRRRGAFRVMGYTIIVPPGQSKPIPDFWTEVASDGRLHRLTKASSVRPWVLGLGSWDPECPEGGQRYTICIEETDYTDFSHLATIYPLFTKEIGASDWMCFEVTQKELDERLWRDNPYKMMGKLGYAFNTKDKDYSVGLHSDAYPPDYDPKTNPAMEIWITVVKL